MSTISEIENVKERVKELERENQALRQQILLKDAIIHKLQEKITLLEQHVLYLDNKLRRYINENTPSSKKPEWEKRKSPDRILKEKKPLGKPTGSNGGTRETPRVIEDRIIRMYGYEDYLGMPIGFVERIVGDIPATPKMSWVRYLLAQYRDPATGDIITSVDPSCPQEGILGPNIRALIAILREQANMSEGQTNKILNSLYGISLAPATIEAEVSRTSSVLLPFYNHIGTEVDDLPVKHSDETGQSVNGENWCMYCFSTQKHAYFFCEKKKNSSHIKSRLGDDWNKVLECDGHSIYTWWHAKQRCWGHAVRKEKWLIDEMQTEERIMLHDAISGTLEKCITLLDKSPPGASNIWDVLCLKNRLWETLNYKWQDKNCQKVADYMKNGWDNWFTFMFVEGVEPTNNLNERDIRKHAMKRKASGTFRSEEGLNNHCIILSVFETWRKNGEDAYSKLVEQIKIDNSKNKW